jgi:hypothetical protein
MPTTLLLAMPAGSARDELAKLIAAHGPEVRCADPAEVAAAAVGCTALVHLPDEDPFSAGAGVAAQAETVASIAAAARARLVFCSSVLLYADGGDDELMANDPELDPPAGLSGLADAELEVFGSSAEVMVLRLGILLAKDGSHARSLSGLLAQGEGSQPRPGVHLPLLDRSTLAEAIAAVAGSQLHGGWDVVAATPTWAEVADWAKAEGLVQPAPAAEPSAADQPDPVWGVSRNVTGAALRGTGAVGEGDWRQFLAGALR